jgi:hypothetical protein
VADHASPAPQGPVPEDQPAVAAPGAAPGPAPLALGMGGPAAIGQLGAGLGMTAPLARAAVRGMGNAATTRMLARSPLSDELRGVRQTSGKGPFFQRLRTMNVSDPDVNTMVDADLAGDDLWLAHNILQYGPEAQWPIHLKVEREMKGWGDSGGKGAVFDLLRAAGAQAGNADLTASIAKVFPAATDDFWLAHNLQQYGPETAWPLHLKIEREMKGWADSHGKGEVFNLMRAAGAQPGNADLTAVIAKVFPAGTEDRTLATLLQRYGPETAWPAPVEEYQCPFDFAPLSSPGERILYNGRYLVVPDAVQHYHELVATATNGSFDSQGGPAQKTFRTGDDVNRIDTGNFSFFIPAAFAGTDTSSVKIEIKERSTGRVLHTRTWNFKPRATAPTTVRQLEADSEIAIGSAYTYEVGPALPAPATAPYYEHQTVLEEFNARVSNLDVADMDPAWLRTNNITDKAGIDRMLFGGGSNNGTFTVDNQDRYYDQHGGGQSELDEAASHLAAPKDVWVDLPQIYTAGPGNVIGNFTIRRIRHAAGGYGLRKWKT